MLLWSQFSQQATAGILLLWIIVSTINFTVNISILTSINFCLRFAMLVGSPSRLSTRLGDLVISSSSLHAHLPLRLAFFPGPRAVSNKVCHLPLFVNCELDIPGDPGSQLPYQEFPPLLPSPYLIGISHFPIQVDWGWSALTSLTFPSFSYHTHNAPGGVAPG